MYPHLTDAMTRRQVRRKLLAEYIHLQRDLAEGDPASGQYQITVHAFRQMGYALISSGFEDDLDRLVRLRVLDGGRYAPSSREQRSRSMDLHLIEQRERA